MRLTAHAHRLTTQLGGVLPRSVAALRQSADWNALSVNGLRQAAEVALDELVVTGMTLLSTPPTMDRAVDDYAAAARELAALGVRLFERYGAAHHRRRIAETIRLSRRTHAVLWQNIVLALGIKTVFLLLAIFGNATMWMAVFADMGASLLVVFNGLRALSSKPMNPT